MGILGQPVDDMGQRMAERSEPVYKSTVPKLGDPDPSVPEVLEPKSKLELDQILADGAVDRWKIRGDFLIRTLYSSGKPLHPGRLLSSEGSVAWALSYDQDLSSGGL